MPAQPPAPPFDIGNILRAQRRLLSGGGAQPVSQPPAKTPVETSSYWEHSLTILRYRWPWGLASLAIVMAVTVTFAITTPEQYRARGQMFLVQSVTGSSGTDQLFSWRVYFSNIALARLGSVEKTGRNAHAVLNAWLDGTKARPEGLPEPSRELGERLRSLGPGDILSLVSVTPDTENVSVEVTAWGEDAAFIQYVAQAALEGLIETLIDHQIASVNTAEIERIIGDVQKDLNGVERMIGEIYNEGLGKGLMPEDVSETLDRIGEVNQSIEETRLAIVEVDQRIMTYDAILASPDALSGAVAIPASLADELLRKELLLDEYRRKYTDENPKMRRLLREIEGLRSTIEQVKTSPGRYGITEKTVETTWQDQNIAVAAATERARRAALTARKENLQNQLKALEQKIAATEADPNTARLRILEKRREALRSLLGDLNRRLEQSRWVQQGLEKRDPSFTKVEAVPVTVSRAAGPGLPTFVLLALFVGGLAAAAVMYWVETMDTTVHSVEGTEAVAKAKVLGEIPFFGQDPFIFPENPTTRTANIFSLLRNHLRYSDVDHPEKAVVITSPRPEDGKSFVAVNLAISFAQEGNRTVLVDCDLRHPRKEVYTEALLLQAGPQSGLLCYLEAPDTPLENVVSATEIPELVVIQAGGVAHNPPRLFRSEAFISLLRRLEEQFDVMIIDTPPVIPVVDAGVIAESTRGVLVVTRWGVTRNHELASTVERLRHVRGKVLGVVLNRSPKSEPDYYYYQQQPSESTEAVGVKG